MRVCHGEGKEKMRNIIALSAVREELEKIIKDDDVDTAIHTSYHGRGGTHGFGIILDDVGQLAEFFVGLITRSLEMLDEYESYDWAQQVHALARSTRSDNMGLHMIYYFPRWELDEEA